MHPHPAPASEGKLCFWLRTLAGGVSAGVSAWLVVDVKLPDDLRVPTAQEIVRYGTAIFVLSVYVLLIITFVLAIVREYG